MIGAVEVSLAGGFRQRLVFGWAVNVKYSRHDGRAKVGGRFSCANDELSGGISCGRVQNTTWRRLEQDIANMIIEAQRTLFQIEDSAFLLSSRK